MFSHINKHRPFLETMLPLRFSVDRFKIMGATAHQQEVRNDRLSRHDRLGRFVQVASNDRVGCFEQAVPHDRVVCHDPRRSM